VTETPADPPAEADASRQRDDTDHYGRPAGGWGSLRGMARILGDQRPDPGVVQTLLRQNKPGGHMCTSCAWTKPKTPHPFEFCENGAKATIWDLTRDRCTPEFFAAHSVTELCAWSDHDLEKAGRLTHPMRYDPASDHYRPCSWDEAFPGDRGAAEADRSEGHGVLYLGSGEP
jgi:anaerobic selenocysteine-containing dehydrogenase